MNYELNWLEYLIKNKKKLNRLGYNLSLYYSSFDITSTSGIFTVQPFDYKKLEKIFSITIKNQERSILRWLGLMKYLLKEGYIVRVEFNYLIALKIRDESIYYSDIEELCSDYYEIRDIIKIIE